MADKKPRPLLIRYLSLFPLAAGVAWFATLTALLLRWLAAGRPRYPGQANPATPFVSDIGATAALKPLFVTGCALTGATFFATVCAVHHVRYSPRFYAEFSAAAAAAAGGPGQEEEGRKRKRKRRGDARWRRALSALALASGLAAAVALFLLSWFDTVGAHVAHRLLLMGTFAGLSVSAVTTTVVWWDQNWAPRPSPGRVVFSGLRKWCIINTLLVALQVVVAVAFVSLLYAERYRPAGVLEWILTYLGSFWLLTFTGFTRVRERKEMQARGVDERAPLLS